MTLPVFYEQIARDPVRHVRPIWSAVPGVAFVLL